MNPDCQKTKAPHAVKLGEQLGEELLKMNPIPYSAQQYADFSQPELNFLADFADEEDAFEFNESNVGLHHFATVHETIAAQV